METKPQAWVGRYFLPIIAALELVLAVYAIGIDLLRPDIEVGLAVLMGWHTLHLLSAREAQRGSDIAFNVLLGVVVVPGVLLAVALSLARFDWLWFSYLTVLGAEAALLLWVAGIRAHARRKTISRIPPLRA